MSQRYLIEHMDSRVDITASSDCPDGAKLREIVIGHGVTSGAYVLSDQELGESDPCPVLLLRHAASDTDKEQLLQLLQSGAYQRTEVIPGLAAKGWVDDAGYLTDEGEDAFVGG